MEYYKIAEVQHTADADLFDESEQELLTVDFYNAVDGVEMVDKREVELVCYAAGETSTLTAQVLVGRNGVLYIACDEAEELYT